MVAQIQRDFSCSRLHDKYALPWVGSSDLLVLPSSGYLKQRFDDVDRLAESRLVA
jgi:hypothetical protein